MALSNARIEAQGVTRHPHEQEAVFFIRDALPDVDPIRLWSLVHLINPSGGVLEIDALVLARHALYLVEIKSHPGTFTSPSVGEWVHTWPDGRRSSLANPLPATDHKAKVLAGLLRAKMPGRRPPWVLPLVFLAHPEARNELDGTARVHVVTRDTFVRAITHGEFPGGETTRSSRVDRVLMRQTRKALNELGLTKNKGKLKLGDLLVGKLIEEGDGFQDRIAQHEQMPELRRRVRFYLVPQASTVEARDRLRRAAEREARLLTILGDHPHILSVQQFVTDGPLAGPCVVFEHVDEALPLATFLRQNPELPFDDRLAILDQVGQGLAYCHDKEVVHRNLHPGSVLVRRDPTGAIDTRLYNFQGARRGTATSSTFHPSLHAAALAPVFRAPEVHEDPSTASRASDLFSLGCLAYHVLTGRPPGTTLQERQRLLAEGHLSLAAASDAYTAEDRPLATELEDVVAFATEVSPINRIDDVREWLHLLMEAATSPEPDPAQVDDPLAANVDDWLPGGLRVRAVLGTGSTARVLKVERDERTYALKVPLSPETEPRVLEEARALRRLRSDRIVPLLDTLELGGRTCLLLGYAGNPLSKRLRDTGPASLDFAARWGSDLLRALEALEETGIQHRDIKPSNLGVLEASAKAPLHLQLLDFSLSGIDPRRTEAGTPAYRDSFLVEREGWDEAADRYSAAVTLYEMLTGVRPRYGQGDAPAIASDAEPVLDVEGFDPAVRDRLAAFFTRALARDVRSRHPSAELMLREWSACFTDVDRAEAPAATPAPSDLAQLRPDSLVEALALSNRARNALDRAGITTVRELLALPRNALSLIRGVGRNTSQEILERIADLESARPDLAGGAPQPPFRPKYRGRDAGVTFIEALPTRAAEALEAAGLGRLVAIAAAPQARVERILARYPGAREALVEALDQLGAEGAGIDAPPTIEAWLEVLLPAKSRSKPTKNTRHALGLDPIGGHYPTDTRDAAKRLGVTPQALYISIGKTRRRWAQHPALPSLHDALLATLHAQGGVAPLEWLGAALPSFIPHDPGGDEEAASRRRSATALARIAAETAREEHQLALLRLGSDPWLALSDDHFEAVCALGEAADELAEADPLLSSPAVLERLDAEARDTPLAGLPPERLVHLAAEASHQAAPSARLELYPRQMPARRALTLSAGALAGPFLKPERIRSVVAARYPEAEPLPDRPELDELAERLELTWNEALSAYQRRGLGGLTSTGTEVLSERLTTTHSGRHPPSDPLSREATEFWQRVQLAIDRRDFRVLEVSAPWAEATADELTRRLDVGARRLDAQLLAAARGLMAELGVERDAVLRADREGPDGEFWQNLVELMFQAGERLVDELTAAQRPLVLTRPGLLARYGLDGFLQRLVDACSRDEGPATLLVVPTQAEVGQAMIHGVPAPLVVPTITPAQRLRVPRGWLKNADRAAGDDAGADLGSSS